MFFFLSIVFFFSMETGENWMREHDGDGDYRITREAIEKYNAQIYVLHIIEYIYVQIVSTCRKRVSV